MFGDVELDMFSQPLSEKISIMPAQPHSTAVWIACISISSVLIALMLEATVHANIFLEKLSMTVCT